KTSHERSLGNYCSLRTSPGPIPWGNQLNTFDRSSFSDNPGLCGEPQPYKRNELNTLPPSLADDDSDTIDVPTLIFVLMGYISGLFVGVVNNFVMRKMQGLVDKTLAGRLLIKACRF
ncbi:LOW QUALITY PROTEIN: hypothetical protein TorRG33x02_278380, partial [Trema orientale]